MTPEAWAARMQRQIKRRAKPGAKERRNEQARALWPTSRQRAIGPEKERARRAAGKCVASDARRRDREAADPALKARRNEAQMASYRKKREHYLAQQAAYRATVSPCYAASVLKLPVAIIPPEVIALVRDHIILKRQLKNHENTIQH